MSTNNPVNSYSSRIHGLMIGASMAPIIVGNYKYHLKFDSMEEASQIFREFVRDDHPTIITADTRPNLFLVYDPAVTVKTLPIEWLSWKYFHCARIQFGYYGTDYYLFGSGKIFRELPEQVD